MAYGIKYKCDFTSDVNGIAYSVRILKKDYVSSITSIRMSGDPVQVNYTNGSENKFETIRGSECVINFFADYENQFDEILTAEKGVFKIEVYKNNLFYWGGFVIQENYSEPFQSAPYLISLRATDGLGDLKLYTLKQYDNSLYVYNIPLLQLLLRCLSNLQNGTELVTSIGLYEFGMSAFSDLEDALSAIDINPYTFLDKNDLTINCSQIVKSILEIYNAYIYYKEGKYYVERVNYKIEGFVKRRIYTINFDSESSLVPEIDNYVDINANVTKTGILKFVDSDQTITYQTPYKSIKISNEPGLSEPIIVNSLFRQWNSGSTLPNNWVKGGTFNIEKTSFAYSGNALKVNSTGTDGGALYGNYLKSEKTLYNSVLSERDTLELKIAYFGPARIMLRVISMSGVKYLSASTIDNVTSYVWSNSQAHLKLFNDQRPPNSRPSANIGSNSGEIAWSTVNETTAYIPWGEYNKIEAYLLPSYSGTSYQVREFQINYKINETAKFDTVNDIQISNKNFTDTYELNASLGEFDSKFILNQLYIGTGQTKNWYREGKYSEDNFSLGYHTSKAILNQYRKPFKKFEGSFLGQFDFGNIYTIQNLTGKYLPLKASMNLKSEYNSIEFYEMLMENENDVAGDLYHRLIEYDGGYNVIKKREQSKGRPQRGTYRSGV